MQPVSASFKLMAGSTALGTLSALPLPGVPLLAGFIAGIAFPIIATLAFKIADTINGHSLGGKIEVAVCCFSFLLAGGVAQILGCYVGLSINLTRLLVMCIFHGLSSHLILRLL